MKCGVRFCGGCNPRFDRGKTLKKIRQEVDHMEFIHAVEDETYDKLLVIGGCSSCCASYDHFNVNGEIYKIWDYSQIDKVIKELSEK